MMNLPLFAPPIESKPLPNLSEGQALHDGSRLLVKLRFEECSDFEIAYPWCFEMDQIAEGTLEPAEAEWVWCYTNAYQDVEIVDVMVLGWYPLPSPDYNEGSPVARVKNPEPENPGPAAA